MSAGPDPNEGKPLVSNGFMEIATALALIAVAIIVLYDSIRLGATWREDGPAPGFFPFWVAVILALSGFVNLLQSLRDRDRSEAFVSVPAFGRVLAVLLPSLVYVALIGGVSAFGVSIPGLGIYLASFLFIALFMVVIGREGPVRAVLVAGGMSVVMFLMFEKWFLVPLPKGPLEAALGLG
jgi:hypothetical protein